MTKVTLTGKRDWDGYVQDFQEKFPELKLAPRAKRVFLVPDDKLPEVEAWLESEEIDYFLG